MIEALIVLIILGVVFYLVETYIPMSPPFKTILRIVVVILLILWLLQIAGIYTGADLNFRN